MTDTFAEQLVKKNPNSSDSMKKVLIIAAGGIIAALMIFLSTIIPFAFIFIAGVAFVLYRLLTSLNIEYEYSVTNGTLDVDKIIAKRKRVSMVTVEVKEFTAFGRYESGDDFAGTTILTSGGGEEDYYAEFKNDIHGDVRLVFSPNERVLECIKPYLPASIRR